MEGDCGENQCGLCVNPLDAAEIAAALELILSDRSEPGRWEKTAVKRWKKNIIGNGGPGSCCFMGFFSRPGWIEAVMRARAMNKRQSGG